MKIAKFHVLILVGAILIALSFTNLPLTIVTEGYETHYYPSTLNEISLEHPTVPVWCKLNNNLVSTVFLSIYDDYPSEGGTAVAPTVTLSHVVEDCWQGQLQTEFETFNPPGIYTLSPGNYLFKWVGLDVTGVPAVSHVGWFSFVDSTTATIIPISIGSTSGGVTLPTFGNYNVVKFQVLRVYAFPEDSYRLTNWLVNDNEGGSINPLVATITSGYSSIQAVFEPNSRPLADFTISKAEAEIGETLTFSAVSSHDVDGWIESWHWDFGDTTIDEGKIVYHSFAVDGVYKVTLTVTDNDGATNSLSKLVTVNPGTSPTPTTYVLTVESSLGGTTSPLPETYNIEEGVEVTFLSFPDDGYVLEYWLVDGLQVDPSETITVTVNQDTAVKAQFIEIGSIPPTPIPPIPIPTVIPTTFNLSLFVLGAVLVGAGFMFRRKRK